MNRDAQFVRDILENVDVILEFSAEGPERRTQFAVARTRDKLIHDYPGVDIDVLWRAIVEVLPGLRATLQKILSRGGP